jgi:hypothetical protein
MLQGNIKLCINHLFSGKDCYFEHDGARLHYYARMRHLLGARFRRRWTGHSGSVEYPPRSPDLIPLDFHVWGDLKNTAYARNQEHCRT